MATSSITLHHAVEFVRNLMTLNTAEAVTLMHNLEALAKASQDRYEKELYLVLLLAVRLKWDI